MASSLPRFHGSPLLSHSHLEALPAVSMVLQMALLLCCATMPKHALPIPVLCWWLQRWSSGLGRASTCSALHLMLLCSWKKPVPRCQSWNTMGKLVTPLEAMHAGLKYWATHYTLTGWEIECGGAQLSRYQFRLLSTPSHSAILSRPPAVSHPQPFKIFFPPPLPTPHLGPGHPSFPLVYVCGARKDPRPALARVTTSTPSGRTWLRPLEQPLLPSTFYPSILGFQHRPPLDRWNPCPAPLLWLLLPSTPPPRI